MPTPTCPSTPTRLTHSRAHCATRRPDRRSTARCTGTSTVPWSRTWCCTTRRPASIWRSGTSGSREHRYRRTVAIDVAAAAEADLPELADVAARTFPLACPPSVTPDNIAAFIDENLSQARFHDYLADPDRGVLAAREEGRIEGYVMLIRGVPDDGDVQQAV